MLFDVLVVVAVVVSFLAAAEPRGIFASDDEATRKLAPNLLVAPPPKSNSTRQLIQGLYRSWKTWEVGEFKNFIFQAW